MINFDQARIGMLQFVHRYPYNGGGKSDIRYKQFNFEDAFKQWFPASPSVTPGIEMAPPDVARFVFQQNNLNLIVAGNLTQLTVTIDEPSSIPTIESHLKKYSSGLDKGIEAVLGSCVPSFSGVIAHIYRPFSGSESDIAKLISETLIKYQLTDIQIANLDFGFCHNGYLYAITVSGYRTFNQMVTPGQQFVHIDADFSEPVETGLQIRLEVNSKLHKLEPHAQKFVNLVPGLVELLSSKASDFLGELMPNLDK